MAKQKRARPRQLATDKTQKTTAIVSERASRAVQAVGNQAVVAQPVAQPAYPVVARASTAAQDKPPTTTAQTKPASSQDQAEPREETTEAELEEMLIRDLTPGD